MVYRRLGKISFYGKNILQRSKVIIFVYDIISQKSFDGLDNFWNNEIKTICGDEPVLALVGNKIDLNNELVVLERICKIDSFNFSINFSKKNYCIPFLFDNIGKKYL